MEIVEVIGIDPSLRYTGIAKVTYNSEKNSFKVSDCQVIQNKTTLKSTEAIKHMLESIEDLASAPEFCAASDVVVESPVMPFVQKFQGSSMIMVAHIAGGAASLFGLDRVKLYQPAQWNRRKKKEETHKNTQEILGNWNTWGFRVVPKNKAHVEHVLDAASMALYHIQQQYIEEI